MDKEKVIKGLHQHCEGSMFDRCGECPYYEIDNESFVCRDMLLCDLEALLKEQNGLMLALDQSNAVNEYLNAEVERLNGLLKEQQERIETLESLRRIEQEDR